MELGNCSYELELFQRCFMLYDLFWQTMQSSNIISICGLFRSLGPLSASPDIAQKKNRQTEKQTLKQIDRQTDEHVGGY